MFTIGDFARHGRVSVRMLRHYDAIGLLRPARVDPGTGRRHYTAGQLARLNRVIALKELGFTLQQVREIVDGGLTTEELRGMLRLRRVELETEVAATTARLARVEARLRSIESEGHMPTDDVVLTSLPAIRVAELTAIAPGFDPGDIGPVIGPLYEELFRRLEAAGITPTGPGVARYEDVPGGDGAVRVHAGVRVSASPRDGHGETGDPRVLDLPAVERAATIVHRGPMEAMAPTEQALTRWLEHHGLRAIGYPREVNPECPPDREAWVTELQVPVTGAH
ncbi:MerR family transcriptional regulator [Streptomyces alkaliphilus]|uniref:MerR family transcriptional regulator n=1 Tax=Streptomyces alkaliphilus TaxID=1472722 RepID=UPI00117DFDD8|nr:MerR family transcriptional regulator [Streptomyces alkaliphilus]MQS08276.1 MerR family transcriptional regulator [Streptomyces alkaliphilus]